LAEEVADAAAEDAEDAADEEAEDEADEEAVEDMPSHQQTKASILHRRRTNASNLRHRRARTNASKTTIIATPTARTSRAAIIAPTAADRDRTINTPPLEAMRWAVRPGDPTKPSCRAAVSASRVSDVLHLAVRIITTISSGVTTDGEGTYVLQVV
jgi:hypothetical protein